jgi:hypothetical protein
MRIEGKVAKIFGKVNNNTNNKNKIYNKDAPSQDEVDPYLMSAREEEPGKVLKDIQEKKKYKDINLFRKYGPELGEIMQIREYLNIEDYIDKRENQIKKDRIS